MPSIDEMRQLATLEMEREARKREERRWAGEKVAIFHNTSSRKIIWDVNLPGIDRVYFKPDGMVGATALQLEHVGKLPHGVICEPYDHNNLRHRETIRIGE